MKLGVELGVYAKQFQGIDQIEIVKNRFLKFYIVHMFMISIMQCKDSGVSKSRELYIVECVGLSYQR